MAKLKQTLLHPAVFIPLLLVTFIAIVILTKVAAWPLIKQSQATQYKENAKDYLQKENFRNAFIEIRKAILKNPTDTESYAIALASAEKSKDHFQYVPGFLSKLMELDDENPEHFIKFILLTLQLNELEEAQDAFSKFPESSRDTEEYHQLGYSIGLGIKNNEMADRHLSELIRLRPDDLKLQFTLSTLRFQSSDQRIKDEAKIALTELATHEIARTPSLRVLLTHSLLDENRESTQKYTQELAAMDNLIVRDHLLILQCQQFLDESGFEAHVDEFLRTGSSRPDDISMILDFLLKNNMPEKAKVWLEDLPEETKANPVVAKKASQVYFITKDYEKLKTFLLDENWENQEYGRFLLLALTSKIEADPIAFRKYWQQCLIEIGSDRKALEFLFQTISNWGWENEAIEVLEKSYHESPGDEETFKVLMNHFMDNGDTTRALEVLTRRVEFNPEDRESKNNYALLSMLTNVNQSRAFSYAKENFNSDNSNPYFATTWALALVLQRRSQEALNLIEFLSEDEKYDPQRALYVAKIYIEAGRVSLAKSLLENVQNNSLLAEEKLLLGSINRSIRELEE